MKSLPGRPLLLGLTPLHLPLGTCLDLDRHWVATRPDKNALRAMLESQVQEKLQHDPDALTTYAAKPEPERKPYTSKPTVQDKAFHKELEQMRADAEAGVIHTPKREPEEEAALSLGLMIIRVCKMCC